MNMLMLRNLEEINLTSFLKKCKKIDADFNTKDVDETDCDECSGRFKGLRKLKKFYFNFSTYMGWTAMTVEVDPFLENIFACLATTPQLETLELKYGNEQVTAEILLALTKSILELKSLRNFSLEFLNTKITDFEIALLAQEIKKFNHLERLTFKVIQNPCASEACVSQFVKNVLTLEDLRVFDIYFRRMNISDQGIENLREHFSEKEELECHVSSRSFYAFRRPYHLVNRQNVKKLAIEPSSTFITQWCGSK